MRVRTVTKGVHTDIITDIDQNAKCLFGNRVVYESIKPKTLRLDPHEAREVIPPPFVNLPILHLVGCVH